MPGGTVAVILLLAHVVNQVFCLDVDGKELKFRDGCFTTFNIICEQELVQIGICLTRVNDSSDIAVYGICPYNTISGKDIFGNCRFGQCRYYYHINFTISQLTEQSCGALNRKGLICSECYDGYGPAVYAFAYECVKCQGSAFGRWALYLFVVLFPITLFYAVVIILNIRATSPPFTAYVLFCQTFAVLDRIYFPGSTKFAAHGSSRVSLLLARTLSGIWNLDFGRYILPPFCVSDGIHTYHALFLDYIPGFYPMTLIFFTCVLIELHSSNFKLIVLLWKPFHKCIVGVRRSWDPKASMINAFATFLLLSISKILFVSSYSLQYSNIYHINAQSYNLNALLYNPNINAFSYDNFPFIILGFSLSTVFVFMPTIFICCYQFLVKIPICCCICKQHILSMLMDTFQGHYKDGTNGTYDWRFMAGLYFLLRIGMLYYHHKYKILTGNGSLGQMQYCFIVTVIVAFVRPYKKFVHNLTETLLLILITYVMWRAPLFQTNAYPQKDEINISIALLQLIPHSFLAIVITLKIVKLLLRKLIQKSKCKGHPIMDRLIPSFLNKILSRLIGNDDELSSLTAAAVPTHTYRAISQS